MTGQTGDQAAALAAASQRAAGIRIAPDGGIQDLQASQVDHGAPQVDRDAAQIATTGGDSGDAS